MKRIIALFCVLIITGAVCSACGNKPKGNDTPAPTAAEATAAPTEAVTASKAADAPAAADTQAPKTAEVSDYVKNAKENVVVLPGGGEKRLRLPELLIDSSDARAANQEIMMKFGEYFDDPEAHNYVISMDYDAYLYQNILSVFIKSSVDGGNSSGLCYCFDVDSGSALSGRELCTAIGMDYDTALGTLKTNLTSYYDDKYSQLPNNDEMRSQTISDTNVKASKMFLNGSHQLTAMVEIYAAVGGGRWVDTIAAE